MRDPHRNPGSQRTRQAISGAILLALVSAACSPAAPTDPPPSAAPNVTAAPTSIAAATSTSTVASAPSALPSLPPDLSVPWSVTTPRGDAPVVTCSGEIGATDPVAVVTLVNKNADRGETVLRDYADVANPTTVCNGVGWGTLLDARHLVIYAGCVEEGECAIAVVDLPQATYHWYRMPTGTAGGTLAALAGDLQTMAWSRYDAQGGRDLHVTDAAGDHLVFNFPTHDGRCGSPIDSNIAAFSRSGDYLYFLDQPFPAQNTLVVIGGHEVMFSVDPPVDGWPDDNFPLMALWSPIGDTLYYRKGSHVYEWTPAGGQKRVLTDVPWLYPTMTPDGRHLVYALEKADGNHDLYLATMPDLGNATRIATKRTDPVFLNNRQLWYRSEVGSGCTGEEPQPLIYNIGSGNESESILETVHSIWPGTSSNH